MKFLLDLYITFHQIKVSALIRVWTVLCYIMYKLLRVSHSKYVIAKKDYDDVTIQIIYASVDKQDVTDWFASLCKLHGSLCVDALKPMGTTHFITYKHNNVISTANINLKTKKVNGEDMLFDLIML